MAAQHQLSCDAMQSYSWRQSDAIQLMLCARILIAFRNDCHSQVVYKLFVANAVTFFADSCLRVCLQWKFTHPPFPYVYWHILLIRISLFLSAQIYIICGLDMHRKCKYEIFWMVTTTGCCCWYCPRLGLPSFICGILTVCVKNFIFINSFGLFVARILWWTSLCILIHPNHQARLKTHIPSLKESTNSICTL